MYPFLNNNLALLYDYILQQERMTMNYSYLPIYPPQEVNNPAQYTFQQRVPQELNKDGIKPTQDPYLQKAEKQMIKIEEQLSNGPIKIEEISQRIEKPKKNRNKNQYDKNMIGNIANIVLKEIFNDHFEPYIVRACSQFQINPMDFFNYMKKLSITKNRLGTTELYRIFHQNIDNKFHKIFAFFMVKYLKQDYITYILRQGKMINKKKYLQCASKLMYIPKLTQQEYQILHKLVQ